MPEIVSNNTMLEALLLDFYNTVGNDTLRTLYETSIEDVSLREDVSIENKSIVDTYNAKLTSAHTLGDFNDVSTYYETNKDVLEPLIIDASLMNTIIQTTVALKDFVLNGLLKYISDLNFAYKGLWDSETQYTINDYVMHDNILWCAVDANKGNEPSGESSYWKEIFDFGEALQAAIDALTEDITQGLANKADKDHTHTAESIGAADEDHAHDALYAPISHSNDNTIHVTSNDKNNWNSKANGTHTHQYKDLNGVAAFSHTHGQYANTNHTHDPGFNVPQDVSMTSTGGTIMISADKLDLSTCYDTYLSTHLHAPSNSSGTVQSTIGSSTTPFTYIYGKEVNYQNLVNFSDLRLKENISVVDVDDMQSIINNIKIVKFNYRNDKEKKEKLGVIAQQIQESCGDNSKYFVSVDNNEQYLMVSAIDLIYPLIATVQKLSARVAYLESRDISDEN